MSSLNRRSELKSGLQKALQEDNYDRVLDYAKQLANFDESAALSEEEGVKGLEDDDLLIKDATLLSMVSGEMRISFTHQIKTPLQIILSNAELLLNEWTKNGGENEPIKMLKNILYGVDKIKEIIQYVDHLIKLNREEKEWVDLISIIENAFQLYEDALQSKKVEWRIGNIDTRQNIQVFGNPTKLEQVFVNLLDNSLEALADVDSPKIEVNYQLVNQEVELSFRDNGKGVKAKDQQRIFQPLYSTKSEGTGLGLWLNKAVIQQMGGTIMLGEAGSYGANFIIKLPD